ncbi:MAG TPA: gamma-glutamyltransferase [Bryobacteraceae bacterium]|nr:gamma-glutamyltransferase [Bryobacteraceae bacterium]
MRRIFAGIIASVCVAMAASPQPVRASKGMVSSASGIASDVGVEIMRKGGNAVDAAVAVAFALAVTYPNAGNIGGGGFMILRMADGRAAAIDYRESAPERAHKAIFLDANDEVISNASKTGHRAVGVPGTVAGMAAALEKFGTLKWREVIEPARRLAAAGFPVSRSLAGGLRGLQTKASSYPETMRIFLRGGRMYEEGELFLQPDLAATLGRIAEKGPREFYEGRTAELLVQEMAAHGGLIAMEDLKRYQAIMREPIRGTYRGYELISMPPVSSGGLLLLQMLKTLERYDLAGIGHNSSAKYHLLVETMKRSYADRAAYIGDPAFVKVPRLLTPAYIQSRARSIDPARATPSSEIREGRPPAKESDETTHFSVVDTEGNAVSNTYTLRDGYGGGITVTGAGFLLNNVMDEFAAKAGAPNAFGFPAGEVNTIAPGKRPVSSQTPTIAVKDGNVAFVVGSPGGTTIPNTVLQVVLNVIDHGMNIQEAVDAPRIHHQWLPDVVRYERFGLAADVAKALEARGHRLQPPGEAASIGMVHAIQIEPGTRTRLGASDSRSADGRASGY